MAGKAQRHSPVSPAWLNGQAGEQTQKPQNQSGIAHPKVHQ